MLTLTDSCCGSRLSDSSRSCIWQSCLWYSSHRICTALLRLFPGCVGESRMVKFKRLCSFAILRIRCFELFVSETKPSLAFGGSAITGARIFTFPWWRKRWIDKIGVPEKALAQVNLLASCINILCLAQLHNLWLISFDSLRRWNSVSNARVRDLRLTTAFLNYPLFQSPASRAFCSERQVGILWAWYFFKTWWVSVGAISMETQREKYQSLARIRSARSKK